MEKLSQAEFWERVKPVQGEIIYSIQQGSASLITEVTGDTVKRARPTDGKQLTPSYRDELYNTYCYLVDNGRVTGKDFENVPGHRAFGLNGRFIIALLAHIIPEQIEAFKRDNPWFRGLSGIRLRPCQAEGDKS